MWFSGLDIHGGIGAGAKSQIGYATSSAPSPDLQIAGDFSYAKHIGNSEIFTADPDGSNQTQLTSNSAFDAGPSWSPDRTQVVFGSNRDGNWEIYVRNADGTGSAVNLTNHPATEQSPTWSPDGTQIAFMSDRDGNPEVYVMNADGSGQTRLTNESGADNVPSWSPDGTQIAFASARNGNQDIYVMNADGTGQTQLTFDTAGDYKPSWSPDGTQIVFNSTRSVGTEDIFVTNADGSGSPVRITTHPAHDTNASWSPDGKRIAFESIRDGAGKSAIYVINADGSDPTRLISNPPVIDGAPAWAHLRHIGTTSVGSPVAQTLTIENPGDGTLSVSNISSSDGQFTVSPMSFGVLPGGSQNVTVTFNPTLVGTQYATLTIASNDPDDGTIELIVNGIRISNPPVVNLVSPPQNDIDASQNTNVTSTECVGKCGSNKGL